MRLKHHPFSNKMECPICYHIMDSNIHTTSCNHIFHKKCIKNIQSCPLCRHPIHIDHSITIYHQKCNPYTGHKWTIGMGVDGTIKCSFPFWIS